MNKPISPEKRAFLRARFGVTDAEIDEQLALGESFASNGWRQTSAKYRSLARVPEGMTALEALRVFAPNHYEDVMRRAEHDAAEEFRTYCAARVPGCALTLTPAEFAGFKAAGGGP